MIPNVYVPNNKASKYMWQKLMELQGDIDKFNEVTDLNTFLLIIDRSRRPKFSKTIDDLESLVNQLELIVIVEYSIPHQQTTHCSQNTQAQVEHSGP